MRLFQGTVGPTEMGWRDRLWWVRHNISAAVPRRRSPGDTGDSPVLLREFGGWTVRARRGWRQFRWITPPLYYTRAIPAADRTAAGDWAMGRMGL